MADSNRLGKTRSTKKVKDRIENEAGDSGLPSPQTSDARVKSLKNRYSEGDMGKEEAFRDIAQILDEVESESKVIPIPVVPYGERKSEPDEYSSPEEELEDDLEAKELRDQISVLQKLEAASTSQLLQVKKDALLLARAASAKKNIQAPFLVDQSVVKMNEMGLFSSPDRVPFTDEEKEREFTALISTNTETETDDVLEPRLLKETIDPKDTWRVDLEYLASVQKSQV